MNTLLETVRNGKSVGGCKVNTWWQIIKVENYIVLLLHELIGIVNNILNHFNDTVKEDIECLDPKDIIIWRKLGLYKQMIEVNMLKRDG